MAGGKEKDTAVPMITTGIKIGLGRFAIRLLNKAFNGKPFIAQRFALLDIAIACFRVFWRNAECYQPAVLRQRRRLGHGRFKRGLVRDRMIAWHYKHQRFKR